MFGLRPTEEVVGEPKATALFIRAGVTLSLGTASRMRERAYPRRGGSTLRNRIPPRTLPSVARHFAFWPPPRSPPQTDLQSTLPKIVFCNIKSLDDSQSLLAVRIELLPPCGVDLMRAALRMRSSRSCVRVPSI